MSEEVGQNRSQMRRIWWLGLLASAVFAAGSSAALTLPRTLHDKTTTTPLLEKVTKVVVNGDVGDLTIKAGTPARVTTEQRWNLAAPTVTETIHGGVLMVTTRCPNLPENNCSVDVVATVPSRVAVDATAGVGTILTRSLSGPEVLHSGVGSIASADVRATTFEARVGAGDVLVSLPAAPGVTTLVTGTGDIHASVPPGGYVLATRSEVGHVYVTGVTDDAHASRRLTASTGAGDVFVTGH